MIAATTAQFTEPHVSVGQVVALESIGLRARWLGAASLPGPEKPVSLVFLETVALPSGGAALSPRSGEGAPLKAGRTAPPR